MFSRVASVAKALLFCAAACTLLLLVTARPMESAEADRAWVMRSERELVAPAAGGKQQGRLVLGAKGV